MVHHDKEGMMTLAVVVELEAETLTSSHLGRTGDRERRFVGISTSLSILPSLFILCPESMDDATHIQGGLFSS